MMNKKIIDYDILVSSERDDLKTLVKIAMKEEWHPMPGGFSIRSESRTYAMKYCQAMVKYEKEES